MCILRGVGGVDVCHLFKNDGLTSRPDTLNHESEKFKKLYEALRIMELDLRPCQLEMIGKYGLEYNVLSPPCLNKDRLKSFETWE